jgi:Family of unknown function (DUF6011)
MTTPPALAAEYRKAIPAKFVTKRDGSPMLCMTCGQDLVMGQAFAATNGDGWHSYCATCASSTQAQIGGLVNRIEALVAPLGENVPPTITLLVEQATPHIEKALATGDVQAFLAAKGCLLGIRTAVGLAKRADRDAHAIDLSAIPAGCYAVPGGDTRLKVKIDKPTSGRWAGFVFVKDAAVYGQGTRYGMQKPGQTYRGQIEDQLRAILADPMAASAAYGHLTSTCGICGRPLEEEGSVERGIGPVCIKNVGWSA